MRSKQIEIITNRDQKQDEIGGEYSGEHYDDRLKKLKKIEKK